MIRFKALSSSLELAQKAAAPPAAKETPASKITQNLLVHIPGEASGFYLMSIDAIRGANGKPKPGSALAVGVMAVALLLVVRWLAGASRAVIISTVIAFAIWMSVLDTGFLRLNDIAFPDNLGFVVALFYSAVVTALGTAGKLK